MIKHCNDFYSFDEEDTNALNLPGWRPFDGCVDWANFSTLCPAPWNYVLPEELQNLPSWGFFHVYNGGGYVANLGYNRTAAAPLISHLHKYGWIDRQTRVVFLEFVIYNPSTGYISISTFYYELLPTGYGNPFATIDTFPLTSTQTGFYQFYLICQLLFIIIVTVFLAREVYRIYRMRCSYFRDVWNWVEILYVMVSFLVVIFFVVKSKRVLKSALKVKENPFVPVSFQGPAKWHDVENGVLAIAVFITTLKLLRMIRFNPHISILMSSLRDCKGLLLSYFVIFLIVFLAYAQLGKLVLGNDIQSYSTFHNTLSSELLMSLGGKMGIRELKQSNRILGPLFGFSFMLANAFIFVNFFVAILNDSYEQVKCNTDKQSQEFEMADFILERLRDIFGCGKPQPEEKNYSNAEDDSEVLERQEPKQKPTMAFTSAVSQSEPRKVKIDLENCPIAESTSDRRKHQLKLRVSSIMAFDCLYQETFKKLDLWTEKFHEDDEREDEELLSLTQYLHKLHCVETDTTGSELHSTLGEIEVLATSECVDEDYLDDVILDFIRDRASRRKLPQHLRSKQQLLLQSAIVETTTQPAKRKASDSKNVKRGFPKRKKKPFL